MNSSTFSFKVHACAAILFALIACQKTDSGLNPFIDQDEKVTSRQDCSNCDCSCFVELKDDNAAALKLCGTCDGPTAGCTGDATCNLGTFSGDGHTISLTSTLNPRYSFCEEFTSPFWIENTSTTDTANVVISCTAESGIPQTIEIQLLPTERRYIKTDGDCLVSTC